MGSGSLRFGGVELSGNGVDPPVQRELCESVVLASIMHVMYRQLMCSVFFIFFHFSNVFLICWHYLASVIVVFSSMYEMTELVQTIFIQLCLCYCT